VTYRAYGLTFTSSVPVPALRPLCQGPPDCDARVDIGTTPHWVQLTLARPARIVPTSRAGGREEHSHLTLKVHENDLFSQLAYADGCRFLVDMNATRIWGEAGRGLCDDDLFVYLLGPVMGFVLRKRGCLALHASVAELNGVAFALAGSASSGKSTTAAALALRGIPVLTEDVTPVKQSDDSFIVEPGYPRICLWPDSVKQLLGSPDALPLLTPNWEKRYLPLDGVRAHFAPEPKPLGAIYLLSPRADEATAPRIEEISPCDALLVLVQNTYMNYLLDRDQRAAEFDFLAKLADRVPTRRITPHADPARLPALCDLIIEDVMSLVAAEPARTTLAQPS
jgi:hypothetical protein